MDVYRPPCDIARAGKLVAGNNGLMSSANCVILNISVAVVLEIRPQFISIVSTQAGLSYKIIKLNLIGLLDS